MKKYVELAKKYLADNDSVTLKELEANEEDAFWTAKAAEGANEKAAFYASKVAYKVADVARAIALTDDDDYVEHCKQKAIEAIKEYEELTNEPTH